MTLNITKEHLKVMDKIIKFSHFDKTGLVNHCYSTRLGGVSNGVFMSMNLSFSSGDKKEHVYENYRRLSSMIDLNYEDLVLSNQVHDNKVRNIKYSDKGKGLAKKSDIIGVDGLITNEKGLGLTCFFADCVPLFFLDPVHKIIAISHAGWRGTVKNIGGKTVEQMMIDYGSIPNDILVGIGPSIGDCCYEVSEDVKKEFATVFNDDIIAKIVTKEFIDPEGHMKAYINLWEANRQLLIDAGILPHNIEISGLCTKCHSEQFFSHRVMGTKRGSQVGIIALK